MAKISINSVFTNNPDGIDSISVSGQIQQGGDGGSTIDLENISSDLLPSDTNRYKIGDNDKLWSKINANNGEFYNSLVSPSITTNYLKIDDTIFNQNSNGMMTINNSILPIGTNKTLGSSINTWLSTHSTNYSGERINLTGGSNYINSVNGLDIIADDDISTSSDNMSITVESGDFVINDDSSELLSLNSDQLTPKVLLGSTNFVSGFSGEGWRLTSNDIEGEDFSNLEIDNLTVRRSMRIYELIINKIRATNGSLWVSDALEIDLSTTSGLYIYTAVDDLMPFDVNDILRTQVWDNVNNTLDFIEARVTEIGDSASFEGRQFARVSYYSGNTRVFREGDTTVRIGNTTNTSRQNAMYLTSSDNNNPYMDILAGVDSNNFSNKTKVRLGNLEGLTFNDNPLEGFGLYGENVNLSGSLVSTTGAYQILDDGSGFLGNGSIEWDADGNASFDGNITSQSGNIGGFDINSVSINSTYGSTSDDDFTRGWFRGGANVDGERQLPGLELRYNQTDSTDYQFRVWGSSFQINKYTVTGSGAISLDNYIKSASRIEATNNRFSNIVCSGWILYSSLLGIRLLTKGGHTQIVSLEYTSDGAVRVTHNIGNTNYTPIVTNFLLGHIMSVEPYDNYIDVYSSDADGTLRSVISFTMSIIKFNPVD